MAATVDLSKRSMDEPELMDDFSVDEERLEEGLHWLVYVNKWLGGYQASFAALRPLFKHQDELSILDVGTGLADYPAEFVEYGDQNGAVVNVRAIDANARTLEFADVFLQSRLNDDLRTHVMLEHADATQLPYTADHFDVVHAALFLHHFDDQAAVTLLRELNRVARVGVIINDLHRHPMAYYGVKSIGALTGAPEMFKHDGPLSVRRAFARDELADLAKAAGLVSCNISWRWAFRWVLSSFKPGRTYA